MNYIKSANGIRGLAVLIVLSMHAIVFFFPSTPKYLSGTGKIGVWLFFVLSAFLLTNKFIESGLSKKTLVAYVIGRFFRIIPLFIIAVIFYYLIGYIDKPMLIDSLAFSRAYSHLWTIPVEFKFYFSLPVLFFIMFYAYKKYGILSVFIISGIVIFISQIFFPYYMLTINNIYTSWYYPCFVFGVVLSFIMHDMKRRGIKNIKYSGTLSVMCLLTILLIVPAFSDLTLKHRFVDDLSNSYMPLGIAWSLFILFCINNNGIISAFFSSRMMTKIGNYSFSIYLFHWFFLISISSNHSQSFPYMILAVMLSIVCGALVYYAIELKIEKFRHGVILKKIIMKVAD